MSIDGSGSAGTWAASHVARLGLEGQLALGQVEVHRQRPRARSSAPCRTRLRGSDVEELDLARHLEVGQPLLGEGDHVVGGERVEPRDHDVRLADLAHPLVGHADDRDVVDAVEPHQRLLDLGRVDVEAAGDVHVLEPVGDGQVAVLVEGADVAGVQPAVGVDGLGGWPPGRRGSRASRTRRAPAARRPRRQPIARLHAGDRAAAGGGDGLGGVALAAHRHDDRLGHPEGGDDLVDAEALGLGAASAR